MRDTARLVDDLYFTNELPSVEELFNMYRISDDRRNFENRNNIIPQTAKRNSHS